jgi:hypothetical protein
MDTNLIISGDTDAIFLTITPILQNLGAKLVDEAGAITPVAMEIITELGGEDDPNKGYISKFLRRWAKKELLSLDPRFEFKREKLSDIALFFDAKKRYITHNLDIEGVPVHAGDKKEWSYTGVEVVSATMAEDIKKLVKNAIQKMILTQNPIVGNSLITEIYDAFCQLPPETLATRKSIKDLGKYEKKANGFVIAKGTPQNSKVSILHNQLIKHLKLDKKYETIKSGDKIKMLYVSKNNFGIECIGFKNKLPNEFGFTANYDVLYLKNIHPIFERLYEAVGWSINNPTKNYKCDLLSVFE